MDFVAKLLTKRDKGGDGRGTTVAKAAKKLRDSRGTGGGGGRGDARHKKNKHKKGPKGPSGKTCHKCGKSGHFKRDCPNFGGGSGAGGGRAAKARHPAHSKKASKGPKRSKKPYGKMSKFVDDDSSDGEDYHGFLARVAREDRGRGSRRDSDLRNPNEQLQERIQHLMKVNAGQKNQLRAAEDEANRIRDQLRKSKQICSTQQRKIADLETLVKDFQTADLARSRGPRVPSRADSARHTDLEEQVAEMSREIVALERMIDRAHEKRATANRDRNRLLRHIREEHPVWVDRKYKCSHCEILRGDVIDTDVDGVNERLCADCEDAL